MIKKQSLDGKVAGICGVTPGYVTQIRLGSRATNSKKAKEVQRELAKWQRKVKELEAA